MKCKLKVTEFEYFILGEQKEPAWFKKIVRNKKENWYVSTSKGIIISAYNDQDYDDWIRAKAGDYIVKKWDHFEVFTKDLFDIIYEINQN